MVKPQVNTAYVCLMLLQEEEEAAQRAEEAEGAGGAEDGPARRLHRRQRRLVHVLPQHHQETQGEQHRMLTHKYTLR